MKVDPQDSEYLILGAWNSKGRTMQCDLKDKVSIVTGAPKVVHNLSSTAEEPVLRQLRIIGHFRYPWGFLIRATSDFGCDGAGWPLAFDMF